MSEHFHMFSPFTFWCMVYGVRKFQSQYVYTFQISHLTPHFTCWLIKITWYFGSGWRKNDLLTKKCWIRMVSYISLMQIMYFFMFRVRKRGNQKARNVMGSFGAHGKQCCVYGTFKNFWNNSFSYWYFVLLLNESNEMLILFGYKDHMEVIVACHHGYKIQWNNSKYLEFSNNLYMYFESICNEIDCFGKNMGRLHSFCSLHQQHKLLFIIYQFSNPTESANFQILCLLFAKCDFTPEPWIDSKLHISLLLLCRKPHRNERLFVVSKMMDVYH